MTEFATLFSKDVSCMQYSAIRRMAKLALHPDIISFAAGAPNADTFPAEDIRKIAASILESDSKGALQYGLTLGYGGLIEAVLDFCRTQKGISVSAEQICITSGSQQGVDLIGRLFLDPGDVVLLELPSYVGAISAFRNLQAELIGVHQAADGIDIDDLVVRIEACRRARKKAKLIYVIPNFQNPSGLSISPKKRQFLLDVAERFGLLIVEDDPYGEVYFGLETVERLRSIRSLDPENRVIYISSFSKILAAGLRVGWIIAAPEIVQKLDLAKQATDLCGSMLDQRIVAECWSRGTVLRHLPRIRGFYSARCAVMLGALAACMPAGVSWTRPGGGLFLWLTLPDRLDSETLLADAIKAKVTYVPGRPFHVNGKGSNTLRLAFSKESADNIGSGIDQLARVFRRHLE
jgi:2-aminoadipate transaminase